MELTNVIALIVLVLGVAGSLFAVYLNLSSKIDRTYERLDENKEQYYDDFILKTTHEESIHHVKELHEQRHAGLEKLVAEKLDNLTKEIKSLKEVISEMKS